MLHTERVTPHESQSSFLNHRHEKEMVAGEEMDGGKTHVYIHPFAYACVCVCIHICASFSHVQASKLYINCSC